jgi:hypothetical protein
VCAAPSSRRRWPHEFRSPKPQGMESIGIGDRRLSSGAIMPDTARRMNQVLPGRNRMT